MQKLEALTREAQSLAQNPSHGSTSTLKFVKPGTPDAEAARQMQICNACRYCESFCAVFGAMTRRIEFNKADMHYLSNLCHNCGACYHACQYAAPHEFAVNVPQAMARVRTETYIDYAWPHALGGLYKRNGLTLALATAFGLALFLFLTMRHARSGTALGGDFYAILSHDVLAAIFGIVFLFAAFALGVGVTRFCRAVSTGEVSLPAAAEATHDALRLKYLDGGHGDGCNEESDRFTLARRRFHHFTFYGFMLCFASTALATFYHYVLGKHAPYPLISGPVMLGTLGGISLLIGCTGLFWLNLRRDPVRTAPEQRPMDRGFLALLLLVSASGLALLAWRETDALAALLAIHLGSVLALFATLPYGKFAHGIFRSAALLKYAIEKRTPNRLGLGPD